jgi:predicted phage-related endonuclease
MSTQSVAPDTSQSVLQGIDPELQSEQTEREHWLQERRKGIGGSDLRHLFARELEELNEADAGCELRLWFEKIGQQPDYPEIPNDLFERGTELEPLVAGKYERETGRKLRRQPARVNKDYPWARVNMDRQVLAGHGDVTDTGVLEIKTHNYWVFKMVRENGLKLSHMLQLQHGMFVPGYRWGSFGVFHPDSWTLWPSDRLRHEPTIDKIKERGDAFWKLVVLGKAPDPLPRLTDDRCKECPFRKTCRGQAFADAVGKVDTSSFEPTSDGKQYVMAPRFSETFFKLFRLKEQIKNLEAQQEMVEEEIGAALAAENMERVMATHPDWPKPMKVLRMQGKWAGLDQKAIKAKYPAIYEEMYVEKPHEKPTLRTY